MTEQGLINNILRKYTEKYGNDVEDLEEYTEYLNDMTLKELEHENTLIPEEG